MPKDDITESFDPQNNSRYDELARQWASGELRGHVERLLAFVDQNRDAILGAAGAPLNPPAALNSIKSLIVVAGTIDHASEMSAQVAAIRQEIQRLAAKGESDHRQIAAEWTSRHSAQWRVNRVREYLFVVDRCSSDIISNLYLLKYIPPPT